MILNVLCNQWSSAKVDCVTIMMALLSVYTLNDCCAEWITFISMIDGSKQYFLTIMNNYMKNKQASVHWLEKQNYQP